MPPVGSTTEASLMIVFIVYVNEAVRREPERNPPVSRDLNRVLTTPVAFRLVQSKAR